MTFDVRLAKRDPWPASKEGQNTYPEPRAASLDGIQCVSLFTQMSGYLSWNFYALPTGVGAENSTFLLQGK